jgi:hypothetical protein
MFPIHDLFVKPLLREATPAGWRLPVLRYADHLLRRFGLAEELELEPGQSLGPQLRLVADEVWALVEGRAEFTWEDRRPGSPTQGSQHSLRCEQPTLVLAPFGVTFGCRALEGPARLIRLASHAPDEIDDLGTP